jgi:[acyl-carrier-protein] S-malonyltransferase
MFAGQGAQSVGMGKALYEAFAEARETFAEAERASGLPLRRLCFEGPAEALAATEVTQPALLTVDVAAWRVVARQEGLEPLAAAGLSLGEYAALVAAEAVDFATAVRLVQARGRLMQAAVPAGEGGMLALMGLERSAVEALCREVAPEGDAVAANFNCPGQVVVSGRVAALERVREAALQGGARRAMRLDVSAPFHMPLLGPARQAMLPLLEAVAWQRPRFPVVANLTGRPLGAPAEIVEALARQVDSPVEWQACVEAMVALGAEGLVELGPGRALCGFARRIAPDVPVRAVQSPDDLLVRS